MHYSVSPSKQKRRTTWSTTHKVRGALEVLYSTFLIVRPIPKEQFSSLLVEEKT